MLDARHGGARLGCGFSNHLVYHERFSLKLMDALDKSVSTLAYDGHVPRLGKNFVEWKSWRR